MLPVYSAGWGFQWTCMIWIIMTAVWLIRKSRRSSYDVHVPRLLLFFTKDKKDKPQGSVLLMRHEGVVLKEGSGIEGDDRLFKSLWARRCLSTQGRKKITKRSIPEQGWLCWHLKVVHCSAHEGRGCRYGTPSQRIYCERHSERLLVEMNSWRITWNIKT